MGEGTTEMPSLSKKIVLFKIDFQTVFSGSLGAGLFCHVHLGLECSGAAGSCLSYLGREKRLHGRLGPAWVAVYVQGCAWSPDMVS